MKKHSFKIRTILVGLLATFATVVISVPAKAHSKPKAENATETIQPKVTFLGTENNNALFSVAFDNETPVKFDLRIKDAEGDVLYKQSFEASKFVKIFKLTNDGSGSNPAGLTFQIQVKPSGALHNFEVNSTTEVVNEVVITKL